MILSYVLLDPTKNRTILVLSPVPAALQPTCAARLMAAEPTAEQAGFVAFGGGDADVTLRMAGGEFCGNATMCAAALFCERAGLGQDESARVRVRVSGAPNPLAVDVAWRGDRWETTAELPHPLFVGCESLAAAHGFADYPVVKLAGITHVIAEAPVEDAEKFVRRWCAFLGADALGLMQLDMAAQSLRPLVYVPAADTLFWENSCASGTAAVGAYLAARDGRAVHLALRQPGGTLQIDASPDGCLRLGGTVVVEKRGALDCDP